MLFELTSNKTLAEITAGLEQAAARHGFGVLAVHDLKATLNKKGVEFAQDSVVYEICNPRQAKRALEANPAISTALPCRIAVYREGEAYKLATLRPTLLMQMFGGQGLDAVAREVEETVTAMMKESA
jgi:uncharacterized protein (DUF302 family)